MRIENFPKLKRCDHSPKRDEFIDVSLDPPYFSLDSPFKPSTINAYQPHFLWNRIFISTCRFLTVAG